MDKLLSFSVSSKNLQPVNNILQNGFPAYFAINDFTVTKGFPLHSRKARKPGAGAGLEKILTFPEAITAWIYSEIFFFDRFPLG